MELHDFPWLKLASCDMDLAYDGCGAVWYRRRVAPLDERIVPPIGYALVVRCFVADDRKIVAQCFRSSSFWGSPTARGVSGMDSRAQRSPEHPLLDSDDGSVFEICPASELGAIFAFSDIFCPGSDV